MKIIEPMLELHDYLVDEISRLSKVENFTHYHWGYLQAFKDLRLHVLNDIELSLNQENPIDNNKKLR